MALSQFARAHPKAVAFRTVGGTVAQEGYALAIRRGPEVARLGPHQRGPRAFLPARVLDAGGPRVGDGRAPFVARFVAPWAFTTPFFEERGEGLAGFEAQVAALSVPTLVLAGEEGTPIPVPPSRRLREAVPGSGRATTEGGHACLREQPGAFNRAVCWSSWAARALEAAPGWGFSTAREMLNEVMRMGPRDRRLLLGIARRSASPSEDLPG